jgi:very-short-patch-repair endonuclease
MKQAKQLLMGLLGYIGEQAKLVKPDGFQLGKLTGPKYGPTDLAGIPGLQFNVDEADDVAWLCIDRLEAVPPPEPPASLAPFIPDSRNPSGRPPAIVEEAVDAHLAAHPDLAGDEFRTLLATLFEPYVKQWWGWSEQEKPRRQSIDIYTSFFALKQQIEAEETAKPRELVWGIGVAAWKLASEQGSWTYEYPLLTQTMEITLNEHTMSIEVRPRDVEPRLEMDAIVAASMVGAAEVEITAKNALSQSAASELSPFDPGSYAHVLKLIASNLDAKGAYREVLAAGERWPEPGSHLVVTDAWVIFARPRQNNFLLEDLKRLKGKVEQASQLPDGPVALVTPASTEAVIDEPIHFRGLSTGSGNGNGTTGHEVQELYFPLPSNEEQITIVEQLERAPGVTVQGPPGTGKTHTIANIICHFLTTGRRVLVTSRGEQALQVLQDKLPDDVRPLTVALLSSDRDGTRQFQTSIAAIQHGVSQLNRREAQQQIENLKVSIDQTHRELSGIDRRKGQIAKSQLADIEIDGKTLRAQKAAEFLLSGADQHGWLDDELTLAPEHQPQLDETAMADVRLARRNLGEDLAYLGEHLPDPDALPTADQIGELHQTLVSLKAIEREMTEVPGLVIRGNTQEVRQAVEVLMKNVVLARREVEFLDVEAVDWGQVFREKCRMDSYVAERKAFELMFGDIDQLALVRAEFLQRPVVFPVEGFSSPKVVEAVARAAQSGKPFGLLAVGSGDAKRLLSTVKVSGLTPQDADDWQHVQHYVVLHQSLASFVARWNTFAESLSLPVLPEDTFDLRNVEMLATTARRIHRFGTHLDRVLISQASGVFTEVPIEKLHGGPDGLLQVARSLKTFMERYRLARASQGLTALQQRLADKTGAISENLRRFMLHMLGQSNNTVEVVRAEYVRLMAGLRRICGMAPQLATVAAAAASLRTTGASRWAERIERQPCGSAGDDAVIPSQWRASWTWARLRGHLEQIEGRHELRDLFGRRAELTKVLQKLYSDLVSKSAWLATKGNATPSIMSALNGYATAIRRIGRGTGTNASRYRRDAREAMNDAAGAVPCWIMPHARISEAMPADIGGFDLVIVDEASQSDLWALPAILRGKKILVVGDDKQVSPDGSFIAAQQIELLKQRFLRDQPFAADMTPEKSLYDLAARVFAGHQVMLREHFRCVAPIIAYSNRFYGDAIRPLRIPLASERIDPPLVDVFVPTGRRNSKGFNRDEAEAIADEIEAILANPSLRGRTLGVVSLLGIEQARFIDELVRTRFPSAELLARKFTCGEPRAFQGSERDIIFLSMVADPERHHALSRMGHEQRFNVAASRARDRMYLVRSVELDDLSKVDLRRGLIEHFSRPAVGQESLNESPIDLCESGFERDVFTKLTEKGFRVVPQVKVGGFRIDMVVEGAHDKRLAIELDGDEFHGPDRWAHDMNRQHILERAGWVFWRCFASTWSLHKDDVFGELLLRLQQMQIAPIGAVDRLPTLVEHRVWQPRSKVSEEDEADPVSVRAIDECCIDGE